MPTLADINRSGRDAFIATVGPVFEGYPWVAEETFNSRPFQSAEHLHGELCAAMHRAPLERKLALIRSYPDMAGHLARMGRLTNVAIREHECSGIENLTDEELAEFQTLNAAYWGRFGCPFVICTRLSGKEAILKAMRSRLCHSLETEEATALSEIEKISWLRLKDILAR